MVLHIFLQYQNIYFYFYNTLYSIKNHFQYLRLLRELLENGVPFLSRHVVQTRCLKELSKTSKYNIKRTGSLEGRVKQPWRSLPHLPLYLLLVNAMELIFYAIVFKSRKIILKHLPVFSFIFFQWPFLFFSSLNSSYVFS